MSIQQVNTRYKINELVNIFSLTGNKVIPEMHLRKPKFTYSACEPFTKNRSLEKLEIHDILSKTN